MGVLVLKTIVMNWVAGAGRSLTGGLDYKLKNSLLS